jgi:hypothetical protein
MRLSFIKKFEAAFADQIYACMTRKTADEDMATFVNSRSETLKSIFPTLSQPVIVFLNLLFYNCFKSISN